MATGPAQKPRMLFSVTVCNRKRLMLTLKVLSVAALVGSVAWFLHAPDFEPAIASVTSLYACIASFVVDRKKKRALMHQEVAEGGVGIQAGGNVKTGHINTKTTEK
jgi:hypothetical protein